MAAGLGFKDFVTGEVLTAADVDGYLMQGVWVFASAAARDAAVTSPQEGNFAYLKDTNVTTYYTGSAWANLDTTGMTNPMTTTGDTIYSSSGSTPARLGIGTAGQVLTVNSGATAPEWKTPSAGGSTFAGCSLYKSVFQSISSGTDTAITWNSEYFDTDSYHNTSTNTSRITIPTGKGGKYQINFTSSWDTSPSATRCVNYIKKNGTTIHQNEVNKGASESGATTAAIYDLAAADYIEAFVFQNGGSTLSFLATVQTNFSVVYLGA
jgi:hypothetical protein